MEMHSFIEFQRYLKIFALFTILLTPSLQVKDFTSFSGIFLSNATHILFKSTPSSEDTQVVFEQPHGRIVALAVDIRNGHMFWSDVSHVFRGIYSADLSGPGRVENVRRIVQKDLAEVNGLTVDWISRHIYWTDAVKRSIEVSSYDGTKRTQLVIDGLVQPRSILADPVNGFLYWGDQGARLIEQSRLDGSQRSVLAKENVYWPNQLELIDDKLYWVDAWTKSVEQVDLANNTVSTVMSIAAEANDNPVFGLTARGVKLYATVWNSGVVMEINVASQTSEILHNDLGSDAMFDILYMDYIKQAPVYHPCTESDRGGCSHLCLPTDGDKYRCSCPTFGGKTLGADGKTCRDPENILFYAMSDGGQGQVGFIDLDGAPSVERTLVAKSLRPVAIGYDPTKQQVYWSDVHERTVHRAFLNGTGHHIFLNHNHSLGVVDGLFVDWKHGNLYYSNMGHVYVDRAAFYWHKIEMITLDGSSRKTVVTQVEKPRAITVDMDNGYLYYSDWGEHATIMRCELDGSNPRMVQMGLENPNGIALHGGNLLVVDSHAKSRESGKEARTGSLYGGDPRGRNWTEYEGIDLKIPFGISRYHNKIFISDWGKKGIFESTVDGKIIDTSVLLDNIDSPMGLFYSQRIIPSDRVPDVCEKSSRCEEVCTITPSGGSKCSCDSYSPEILEMDNSSCTVPTNFMLVSDMNNIKLRSLDATNKEMSVLARGNSYFSNYAALVYDSKQKTVYFSDVNRKIIFSSSIDGKSVSVFHKTNDVIDGMDLVRTNQTLFWTEFYSGSIVSKSLTGSQAWTLLTGLSKPRALQVDSKKRKLYWTEWGKSPKVGQLDLNTNRTLTLLKKEVSEPNGLHLDVDNYLLYVGDAARRTVFKCDLNSTVCKELAFMRFLPSHIFDLKVKDDWVLYSDWLEHSIMAVSMVTGQQEVILSGLMRPTVFWIENEKSNACPSTSGCSDLCTSLAGNFLCSCKPGRRLMGDHKTCIDDVSYLLADDYLCQDGCPRNTSCARFQSTVNFTCHCAVGFTSASKGGPCIKCPENHYKDEIGGMPCFPCPTQSYQSPNGAGCVCDGGLTWDWEKRKCSGAKPGKCPSSRHSNVTCSMQCNVDSDCLLARKCCHVDSCPGMHCVDPIELEHCVYNGLIYHVGQYFRPDNCVRCQCSSIKPSQSTEYGRAICTNTKCPFLECDVTKQIPPPPGQCCHLCINEELHLKITDCPTDTVTFILDSDKAYVEYLPTLKILDNRRLDRDVHVTKKPRKTNFWWSGQESDERQVIKLKATAYAPDGSTDNDECDVTVYVKDNTPPQITCPNNITTHTRGGATLVTWPFPAANDNVGLSSKPSLNGPISDQFTIGRHKVSYYVTDLANNGAICSFFVDVKLLDTKCPMPPSPYHGTLNCFSLNNTNTHLKSGTECKLTCQNGYTFNIYKQMMSVYTCGSDGTWVPEFSEYFAGQACVKINTMRWWFKGFFSVRPHMLDNTMERDVEAGVKEMFKEKYFNLLTASPALHLNVTRNLWTRITQFLVNFTIEGVQNATGNSYYNQLAQLQQQLKRDNETGRLQVHINGRMLVPAQLSLQQPELRCAGNEEQLPQACLMCPVGTYFTKVGQKCTQCQKGSYQDSEGQRSCTKCPEGSTSEEGSYSVYQCSKEPEVKVHVASVKVPTEVIIGAAVGSLVFVLGVIIIVIVVIFIRRHLNDTKVNYIINTGDNRQMEFANRAFEDHTADDVTTNGKTHNGNSGHSNGYQDNGSHVTFSDGNEVLSADFTASDPSQEFNGIATISSGSVFL